MTPSMSYYHYTYVQVQSATPPKAAKKFDGHSAADFTILVLVVVAVIGLLAGRIK